MERNKIKKCKGKREKMLKSKNGITLVALVVTIVVLLILAGVSVSLVLQNNGIINKSKEARRKYGEAKENEQTDLNNVPNWIEEQVNGNGKKTENLPGNDDTNPYLIGENFKEKEGTNLDNGLVIEDNLGNEYVWIEVPKSLYENSDYNTETTAGDKKPTKSTDYDEIEYCIKKYTSAYRSDECDDVYREDNAEGWFADETEYDTAKKNMLKSVYENGGFYIARYEAGISEPRTEAGDATVIPVSKPNMFPYTFVTRNQAYNLATQVDSGNRTSCLMFGMQWDLVLAFIHNKANIDNSILTTDSASIGNYGSNCWNISNKSAKYLEEDAESWGDCPYVKNDCGSVLLTTGASDDFCKMNIYDIGGNVSEWTLEKYTVSQPSRSQNTAIKIASISDFKIKSTKSLAIGVLVKNLYCTIRGGDCEYRVSGSVEETGAIKRYTSEHKSAQTTDCGMKIGFRVTIY